jgi:isoquinoline 1-oxidoreductase alpha subunit
MLPVSAIGSAKVTTIEGLSVKGDHPVQAAWNEVDVAQCGYCQAGQIMTAAAFLKKNPKPSAEEVDAAMQGNICRCGTYHRIREAVLVASTKRK